MITKQDLTTALQYLGNKIDALRLNPQKIELDLTSKAIEKLQEIDVREMNQLISALQKVADGTIKSNGELIAALTAFEKATKDDSRLVDVLKTSQNLHRQTLNAIERIKAKVLEPEKKDDREYRLLQNIEKAVKAIKLEEKEVDLSSIKMIAKEVDKLNTQSEKQNKQTLSALSDLTTAIKSLPSQIKLSVPKEFKLEENQLRSIRSGGGGAIAMAPLDAPNGGLYSGRQVVTTAGTAVQLDTTSTRCENIIITAESDNTGTIAVGDSSVVAAAGSEQGVILTPLGSVKVKVGDLSKIYIDATVNGDGVSFAYER